MSTSGPNSSKPTTGEVVAGVYNVTPPVLVDGQACAIQVDVNGQIKTSGGGGSSSNVNITGINGTAPALTNPLPVELSDGTNPLGVVGNPAITKDQSDVAPGTSAPTVIGVVGGKTNDGTPQYQPIPEGAGGRSVIVEGVAGGTAVPISGSVSVTGTATVAGGKTNNNAAPGATNVGVLPSVANATPPVYTEGNEVLGSTDLQGNTRVVPSPGLPSIIQKNSGFSTGSVASIQIAYGSNVSLGTTLLVVCGVGNGSTPTITDTQGNTWILDKLQAVTGNAFCAAIFRATSKAAGANTVTITNGGANASIAGEVYEVSGLLTLVNYAVDQTLGATATSAAVSAGTSIAPQYTNEFLVAGIGVGTAAQTVTVTAGFPNWSNDSGQLNPVTPAGLFSFVSASAISLSQQHAAIAATLTSEPWAVAQAFYRPYTEQPAQALVRMGFLSPVSNIGVTDLPALSGGGGAAIRVTTGSATASDGASVRVESQASGGGGDCIPLVMNGVATSNGAGLPNVSWQRTPNIWRGSQFNVAGQNIIWTPPSTKKVRLMRYKIEIGEDATITSGPLPINLAFCEQLGTATGATLAYPGFGFTHRDVIPATVLSTGANISDSDWIDLGNGQVLTTAGRALQMGIMVPQTTGAVNPTWTTSSVTWEAATIGFKTNGSLGNFKLVQQTNAVASAASVAQAAIQVASGNAVFVFWRATVAGGAPTVTVTDTAGNTYTNAAQVTTGNDYIGVAYSINVVGNAANIITVTTTTHTSSQIEAIAIEYAGLGSGGVDAAQVGTTGTSTSPASGNYTPGTAGDLIFSFFGTSASIASQPTIGSNFRIVGSLFNGTQGSINVADNFGNGVLATGIVNVICTGTEE